MTACQAPPSCAPWKERALCTSKDSIHIVLESASQLSTRFVVMTQGLTSPVLHANRYHQSGSNFLNNRKRIICHHVCCVLIMESNPRSQFLQVIGRELLLHQVRAIMLNVYHKVLCRKMSSLAVEFAANNSDSVISTMLVSVGRVHHEQAVQRLSQELDATLLLC